MKAMNRTSVVIGLILIGLLAAAASAASQDIVPFGPERWDVAGGRVVEFLGRPAFMGTATLKGAEFENGVIEFDIAVATDRARSYPGVVFRSRPDASWERFYIRPHRSALYGDVIQYVAAFNGVDSWQFYNGPGATAPAVVPVNQWVHIKVEVSGSQARLFLGGAAEPALTVPRLKHGARGGGLGLMGPADGSAYFSNFSVRADDGLVFGPPPPVDETPGVVKAWRISKPFPATRVDLDGPPEAQDLGDLGWQDLAAEPGGLVDVSRLHPRGRGPDLVFARTVIEADREEIRKYDLGYSDVVTVFLDGKPVFQGNSQYQGRDSSFLGVAGWFDSIYLPLKKGANTLTLAVAEVSGGWGFMLRDATAVFAAPGVEPAWETPKALATPESAAYDPARRCFYVSNYDPANPSQEEGRQSISKIGADGRVESLDWVAGLANPAGLVVVKDRLFAVERRAVAEIDIPQAKVIAHHPLPGAAFPNDIAAGPDGSLYVTDSGRGAIYKWTAGRAEEWLRDARIARPNGVCFDGTRLLVGTNVDGCLKSVDLLTKEIRTVAAMGPGIIDGIERVADGLYLVSHNEGRLFRVDGRGVVVKLLDTSVAGRPIADFCYTEGRIVFPTFTDNRVVAYALGLAAIKSYRAKE